jgi:hypothetical protein
LQRTAELRHRVLGDFPGGEHQPDGTRCSELGHQILEAAAPGRAFAGNRCDSVGAFVIDHARMAVLHQPLCDVAAHAAETDDT